MEGVVFTDRKYGGGTTETMAATTATATAVERTPLDKCTETANQISTMIERFTDEQIKHRGHMFAFQVFLAGTT